MNKFSISLINTILILFLAQYTIAQAPAGYYNTALGKNGNVLKIALHNIIKDHTSLSYSGLWSAYGTTDRKPNGKMWDMYSDKPGATPPYEYTYSTDQCSSATTGTENDCYNREHLYPQSKFGSNYPMYSDLFFVYPTDAFVNGKKSDYPVGKVTSPSFTSMNGSKVGINTYPGAPLTNSFEPIDSFKGDIARSFFYVATRYYSQDGGWSNWELANGADLKPWAIQMLLEWHQMDPVSAKEINRNNKVYAIQHNRNPFIDNPQFANCIWGGADCSSLSINDNIINDQLITIFPNPAQDKISINNPYATDYTIKIINTVGNVINSYKAEDNTTEVNISTLATGMYIIEIATDKGISYKKIVKK